MRVVVRRVLEVVSALLAVATGGLLLFDVLRSWPAGHFVVTRLVDFIQPVDVPASTSSWLERVQQSLPWRAHLVPDRFALGGAGCCVAPLCTHAGL